MSRDPERVERLREQLADIRLQRQLDRAAVLRLGAESPAPVALGDPDAGRGRDTRPPAEPRTSWTNLARHLP